MELGKSQINTFDMFSMDSRKDRVYYEGQEFPAGYFAAEILNFAGEICDPILDRISTLSDLVYRVAFTEEGTDGKAFDNLLPLMRDTVSWIHTCPPFCYKHFQYEWHYFTRAMDPCCIEQNRTGSSKHKLCLFKRFSEEVLHILIAIYNFCLIIRIFEDEYLCDLERRTEKSFARAVQECFGSSDGILSVLNRMPFGETEKFSPYPRLISGFQFVQDPEDEGEWIAVQHIICKRLIDFYVYDLMNGLYHGHAPSQCQNCGKFFLTTNGHKPKYCNGVAPQNDQMTCRQYGAMMHQKEKNKQHPIYRLHSTRTNTIRKHHQRGKISDELRREAICVTDQYRERALMDNDYAANGYAQDMVQENIYEEARKRLQ